MLMRVHPNRFVSKIIEVECILHSHVDRFSNSHFFRQNRKSSVFQAGSVFSRLSSLTINVSIFFFQDIDT